MSWFQLAPIPRLIPEMGSSEKEMEEKDSSLGNQDHVPCLHTSPRGLSLDEEAEECGLEVRFQSRHKRLGTERTLRCGAGRGLGPEGLLKDLGGG